MSLRKDAISGVFWTGLQQFGTQGVTFIITVVLSRILLPSQFGLIAMIGVIIAIGKSLMDAGLSQSLIRSEEATQEDYSTVFFFNLSGSILLYLILYFCAPFIATFYEEPLLTSISRWYGVIFISNAFGAIQYTRLTKIMDFKTQMIVSIPSVILGGIVGITMAINGYGVWSLVASGIVQSAAQTIQLWIRVPWTPSFVFDKEKFKYHFNYGYKLTLSGLLNTVFNNAYVIIIGKFFSPSIVGFYNQANKLKQLPVVNIANVLNRVTFPLFAKIQDDDVRLKMVYKKIMSMVVFVLAPVLIFMAVLATPLFRFVFTEKWLPAVPYFQILCATGILYPIHAYNLNVLKVKGRSDLFLRLEIVKKAIIIAVIGVSLTWGIYGLLYGSVAFSLIAFFINTHYTGKFINFTAWQQLKTLMPYIFTALVCGLAIFLVDGLLIELADILRLIICSIFGVILYVFINYIFKLGAMQDLISIIQKK